MSAYIFRKTLVTLPVLFGTQLLLFLIFFAVSSPTDIARRVKGPKAKEEVLQRWITEKGYDKPVFYNSEAQDLTAKMQNTIFFSYISKLCTFSFGKSDYDDQPIWWKLKDGVGPSLFITIPIIFASLLISIFISMLAAMFRDTYIDRSTVIFSVTAMSVVYFLYIVAGQFLFSVQFKWFPVSGWSEEHKVYFAALPIIIGCIANIGESTRLYRTIMLNEIHADYIRTARAKGLGDLTILFKHLLRNAMIPILTRVIVLLPYMFTGSLLLESFFGIPGLGRLTVDAINFNDFSTISAVVYLSAILYIAANLINDLSYTVVDPRVRLS